MKKRIIITAFLIVFLVAVTLITYGFYSKSIDVQKELLTKAEILLTDGKIEMKINSNIIKQSDEEKFQAVLDTSSTDPKEYTYNGVQLKNLLKDNNFVLKNSSVVTISGADGYSVAFSGEEVLLDKNIYIVYMENNKLIKGREYGGRGPYESIIVSDLFSNRRCKWITKIEVN